MSSVHGSNHSEQSPRHEQNGSAEVSVKRRRIALACLDCRRRKLKCDRIFPACSRCQKAGHPETCTYDPNAVDTVIEKSSTDFPRSDGRLEVPPNTLRRPADSTSFAYHYQLDTDDTIVSRMETHIHRLENRIIDLERVVNSDRQSAVPQNSIRPNANDLLDREPENKDLITFRGKNFKTIFYGASHATSCFAHVS